jgi:putative DNA-invertase from lambdoid prophage Rac
MDRLEHGDCLVVTKLDRLGRNAIDILSTVAKLEANGVRVHCMALGGVDLTSAAGKMMMTVLAAMAAFEKDLLLERTQAGLERAWAAGKVSGRRAILTDAQRADVRAKLAGGRSVSAVAREMGISRMTIMRSRKGAAV